MTTEDTRLKRPRDTGQGGEQELVERDGAYVTTELSREELTQRVARILRDDVHVITPERPRIILATGRCRVGSTALANVFGLSGAASFYQPIKTIMRHVIQDKPFRQPLRFDSEAGVVFFKETFGPYVDIECTFDPLEALLRSGYPPELISVVGLERRPALSYDSWLENWGSVVERGQLLRNFLAASRQNRRVQETARAAGVAYAPFHYEWIVDRAQAFRYLEQTQRLGDGFLQPATKAWGDRGDLWSENSAIRHFEEAEVFLTKDPHIKLDGYIFQMRELQHATPDEIAAIAALGLPEAPPIPVI